MTGRVKFCDTEIALRRGGEEVVFRVLVGERGEAGGGEMKTHKVCVKIRVENIRWLAVRGDNKSWEMVWNRRVVGRGVDGVYCCHQSDVRG